MPLHGLRNRVSSAIHRGGSGGMPGGMMGPGMGPGMGGMGPGMGMGGAPGMGPGMGGMGQDPIVLGGGGMGAGMGGMGGADPMGMGMGGGRMGRGYPQQQGMGGGMGMGMDDGMGMGGGMDQDMMGFGSGMGHGFGSLGGQGMHDAHMQAQQQALQQQRLQQQALDDAQQEAQQAYYAEQMKEQARAQGRAQAQAEARLQQQQELAHAHAQVQAQAEAQLYAPMQSNIADSNWTYASGGRSQGAQLVSDDWGSLASQGLNSGYTSVSCFPSTTTTLPAVWADGTPINASSSAYHSGSVHSLKQSASPHHASPSYSSHHSTPQQSPQQPPQHFHSSGHHLQHPQLHVEGRPPAQHGAAPKRSQQVSPQQPQTPSDFGSVGSSPQLASPGVVPCSPGDRAHESSAASYGITQEEPNHTSPQHGKVDEEFAKYFRFLLTRYRWLFIRGKAARREEIQGYDGNVDVSEGFIQGDGDLRALRDIFFKDKHFKSEPGTYVAEESSHMLRLVLQRLELLRNRVATDFQPPNMLGLYYCGHGTNDGQLIFMDKPLMPYQILPQLGGVYACAIFDSCFSAVPINKLREAWQKVAQEKLYDNYHPGSWKQDPSPENCVLEWGHAMSQRLRLKTPGQLYESAIIRFNQGPMMTPRQLRGLIYDFVFKDAVLPLLVVLGSAGVDKQAKQCKDGGLFSLWLTGRVGFDQRVPTEPAGILASVQEQKPCFFAVGISNDVIGQF